MGRLPQELFCFQQCIKKDSFEPMANYKNPAPTVDLIIELLHLPQRPIVLIERTTRPTAGPSPAAL
jgi:hypothetical protein